MLDIKFIRENSKLVTEKSKQKGYEVDVKKLLKVDEERRKLIEEVDKLRTKRKEAAEKRDEEAGRKLKDELKKKEDELEKVQEEYYKLIREIPNLPKADVKTGKDESENDIIKTVGEKPKFDFDPKDHLELGLDQDLIDVEKASKVSGSRFAYLKNEAVILELALIRFALDVLTEEGFVPVIPPAIINEKAMEGLGYREYLTGEGYKVEEQYLIGTAEHSIVPMHMDEIIDFKNLPLRYAAFSSAFRKEAGSYGKDVRGIFRLHQFDKVEMVSFVKEQDEDKEHEFLLSLEEKLFHDLKIPYQVVKMCTGDLGFPIARKYDIEAWIPSEGRYREVTSASTAGDFQTRRLNIKYKEANQTKFAYALNATAFAIGRTLIAIMENYQQKDGSIKVPKVLQKYTNFSKIPSR